MAKNKMCQKLSFPTIMTGIVGYHFLLLLCWLRDDDFIFEGGREEEGGGGGGGDITCFFPQVAFFFFFLACSIFLVSRHCNHDGHDSVLNYGDLIAHDRGGMYLCWDFIVAFVSPPILCGLSVI